MKLCFLLFVSNFMAKELEAIPIESLEPIEIDAAMLKHLQNMPTIEG